MEAIDRENEFSRVNLVDGFLITGAKKWFLRMGYNYSYAGVYIEKVKLKVPVSSIRKMRIMPMGIVSIVFFLLAAMALGLSFVQVRNQETGEMSQSHVGTGVIIALVLTGLGFLYLRSKMGRVKVLQTTYGGNTTLLYASQNIEELKLLREMIKNERDSVVHEPPPLPPSK